MAVIGPPRSAFRVSPGLAQYAGRCGGYLERRDPEFEAKALKSCVPIRKLRSCAPQHRQAHRDMEPIKDTLGSGGDELEHCTGLLAPVGQEGDVPIGLQTLARERVEQSPHRLGVVAVQQTDVASITEASPRPGATPKQQPLRCSAGSTCYPIQPPSRWSSASDSGKGMGRDGCVTFNPDEAVQERLRLVLAKFRELRSAKAIIRHLRHGKLLLPVRPLHGPAPHDVVWPNNGFLFDSALSRQPAAAKIAAAVLRKCRSEH